MSFLNLIYCNSLYVFTCFNKSLHLYIKRGGGGQDFSTILSIMSINYLLKVQGDNRLIIHV